MRPFFPYYRDIRSSRGKVLPLVETQRAWVKHRMAKHPFAKVIDLGVEVERGYEGPNTPVEDRMGRPVLKRILEAIQSDEFCQDDPVILVPDMPTHYQYRWLFEEVECPLVPIHPHIRTTKQKKRWVDDPPIPAGGVVPLTGMGFSEIWDRISVECSYFLGVVKKLNSRLMFECAHKMEEVGAYVGKPKVKGKSEDFDEIPSAYSAYSDRWCEKNGILARRGNGIVCSSHPEHARSYGRRCYGKFKVERIYTIFPKNGFNFSWTRNVRELLFSGAEGTFPTYSEEMSAPPGSQPGWDQGEEEYLWSADFCTEDLAGALLSGNEIVISGSAYYALDWTTYRQDIKHKLGFSLQNPPYLVLVDGELMSRRHIKGAYEEMQDEAEKAAAKAKSEGEERRRKMREENDALLARLRVK